MADQIPTLQEEWRQYRDAVYPKGTHAVQNRETHQAFFAGALVAFALAQKCAELPEPEASAALGRRGHDTNRRRDH
jgi:hypothetical protein